MDEIASFIVQVIIWLAVLAMILAVCAMRTRRRLRTRYHVKLSELSEGLKTYEKGHHHP